MNRIGILTVSDTRYAGERTNESGPACIAAMEGLGYHDFESRIVPDEVGPIQGAIRELCEACIIVLTIGGTGFAPRDVTPEATAPLLHRRADSISELLRIEGLKHTPLSHLSRGIAGVRDRSLVVNLPGSPKAVTQSVAALGPLLEPILDALRA